MFQQHSSGAGVDAIKRSTRAWTSRVSDVFGCSEAGTDVGVARCFGESALRFQIRAIRGSEAGEC